MGKVYATEGQASAAGASAAGAIGGAAVSGLFGIMQQQIARNQAADDRRENYQYNEMSAENADQRTRALYEDFYSPKALMQQYKEAGLSPSMMFGGTPGQGGMSGAQGAGPAGPGTPYVPKSLLEGAQIANIIAQTNKLKAETTNIEEDTKIKDIQKRLQNLNLQEYEVDYRMTMTMWQDKDGNFISAYEIANNSENYEEFLKELRKQAEAAGQNDYVMMMAQEQGQRALKDIYMSTQIFDWNIKTLSSDKVSAEFQEQLIKAMENENFIKLNAKAAVGYLKANIQTAELTETQKEAWNHLIDKLGKKGETTRDIIVVLGMILNNAMCNWNMPNINISGSKHQYKLTGGTWKEL